MDQKMHELAKELGPLLHEELDDLDPRLKVLALIVVHQIRELLGQTQKKTERP
jgi:hypothetical protein